MFSRSVVSSFVLVGLVGTATQASINIDFSRITSNSSTNVAGQFTATVSNPTVNTVEFLFRNTAVVQSSISEIYFDVDNVFAGAATLVQVGTNFSTGGANPSNLPAGNTINPAFVANVVFSADAVGNPSVGIDQSTDSLVMRFTFASGVTYQQVVNAISSGDLRLGLHVRSIGGNGQSDSFVNVVPTPASIAVLGFAGIAGARRRR